MSKSCPKPSLIFWLLMLSACVPAQLESTSTSTMPALSVTHTASALPTATETPTPSPTYTLTNSATFTFTVSPTLTFTPTLTPIPTYSVLRGVVQEHVSCFYGPSNAYLYKYGLLEGNRLEIIGYMADTGYIEVRAIRGHNPCWMNLKWMDVQGDINTVQPIDPPSIKLPQSPYYSALTWSKATREGDEVKLVWDELKLRAGDDSEQEPYLLEVWVCRSGRLTFVPIGLYDTEAIVEDELGCSEPSHARVYAVEKHGYTRPLEILWPQAE
jgi:hypothetical protein